MRPSLASQHTLLSTPQAEGLAERGATWGARSSGRSSTGAAVNGAGALTGATRALGFSWSGGAAGSAAAASRGAATQAVAAASSRRIFMISPSGALRLAQVLAGIARRGMVLM